MYKSDTINIILADYDNARLMDLFNRMQNLNPVVRIVTICQNGQDVIDRASTMKEIHAVITDFNLIDKTAVDITKELAELSPETDVFAISDVMSAEFVFNAKNKGIVEIFQRENLSPREVINQVANYENKKREEYQTLAAEHGAVEKGSKNRKIVKEYVAKTVKQKVILTYNIKGGVGKSTIAANLAVAIKRSPFYSGKRVVLVDFDCGGSNVSTLCDVDDGELTAKNLASWSDIDPMNVSQDEVESLMIEGPHNIMIVPAPLNFVLAEKVSYEIADTVLKVLKQFFDVIVIDGAPNLSPLIDSAITHATEVLLIANPEGQSIKQLSRITSYLNTVSQHSDNDMSNILNKMFIVLNHAQKPSKWDLESNEVSRAIGRPILREVPNSELVKEALHKRSTKQAVELDPESDFSIAVKKLANDLTGAYPEGVGDSRKDKPNNTKNKKGLFGLFKK